MSTSTIIPTVAVEEDFRTRAHNALGDSQLRNNFRTAMDSLMTKRAAAFSDAHEREHLRALGNSIRARALSKLPDLLEQLEKNLTRNGVTVHWAETVDEANGIVLSIIRAHEARQVIKGKSMVSEEMEMNHFLEARDIECLESDMGEYIVQLAGEHPTHILAPAMEKTAEQVAELVARVEGAPVSPDRQELTATARRRLRETFLSADVGITGVNFGVAETGSIVLVENEGNARLVSALPRVHVALMGMERVVPTLADTAVLLRLLARSATGQKLTSYTTVITGPRRPREQDGPEELHVVVLDNGRSSLLHGPYREMLNCIRCGACINVCPVYRKAGGGAYGPVLSGPMGAILGPLLAGLGQAPDLAHASSLCGACTAACPVRIPLHDLLLDLRRDLSEQGVAPRGERLGFWLWSLAW